MLLRGKNSIESQNEGSFFMKRWIRYLSSFLAVCLLVSMLAVTASAASLTFTDEYGTWTYQVEEDGSVTLLKCKTAKKNIVIPATINGNPVKKLGKHLFQNNDTITGVVIPHGIEEIEKMVFFNCDKLELVEIPNSVKTIGDKAFSKCEALETLYVPSSVTELGEKVFEDSPNVDVQCPINSDTAEYLEDNKSEVANYTLIEVTHQNAVPQPEPGVESQTPAKPSNPAIKGKLVTYNFGALINGKPEFTFVVADSMPNLDLMHYVVKGENGNAYIYQGEEVRALMNNRFQLVSMSRYDGKKTETVDFTRHETRMSVGSSIYTYMDEAGKPQADVLYTIDINVMDGDYSSELPKVMEFNSDNEMLTYRKVDQDGRNSMVKNGDIYNFYETYGGTDTVHYAKDGSLITTSNAEGVHVSRFGVKGSCVHITINRSEYREPNGNGFNRESKEVYTYDAAANTTVKATVNLYTRPDGTKERQDGVRVEKADGVVVDDQFAHVRYDEKGNLLQSYRERRNEGEEEGTYEVISSNAFTSDRYDVYRENHRTNGNGTTVDYVTNVQVEDTNKITYNERVVQADSVQDAMGKVSQNFPNEPRERTDDVSYRRVHMVDIHKENGTETNVNTGEVEDLDRIVKFEEMSNYTYIEDTGKYVGWDWTWSYEYADDTAAANGDAVLTQYKVTEYKYSAENNGTWTKTTTYANVKDYKNGSTIDFKDPDASLTMDQILREYVLYCESFEYDPENSGVDNWKQTDFDNAFSFGGDPDQVRHINEDRETDTVIIASFTDGEAVGEIYVNNEATDPSNLQGEVKEQLENMPERLEEMGDMLMGTTEVTTADGTTLTQNEVKEEMIELSEELKEEALEGTNFFEETIQDGEIVPDGDELMDAVEDLQDGGNVPAGNITGSVDHNHKDDGTPVTIINGEAYEVASEPATASVAEPAAAPVAESIAEPATEPAAEPVAEEA